MSDELPPPDLTKTADVPLDGLLPFAGEDGGEVPSEPGETEEQASIGEAEGEGEPERTETIFTQARPVRLVMAEQIVGESPILEEEASHPGPAVLGETQAEPLGTLRALWVDSHDRGVPFYRRQGPLAGLGLFALLIIGAISFPWTRATIESGVVILIDESAETAGVGSGSANREDIENPTSATLVQGTKVTASPGSAEGFQSTSSQIATTAGVSASASVAPASQSAVNAPTTATIQSRQTAETTTITVIAPVQLSCEDPAAIPPACATTTEAPTTTEAGETTTTEDEATTTTEARPTESTVERTTTTEPEPTTTTTEPETTTTTEKPQTTTTTTEPEPTTTAPDTTVPDTTDPDTTDPDTTDPDSTTTTEPETTTTTEPETTTTTEPPSESDGTVHPAVGCTSTTQPDPEETSPRTLC